jgi:hypothetical protein
MALIEKHPDVNTHEKIDAAKIHSPYEIDNEAALQLVVQDTEKTDAWIDAKRWTLRWREADTLYQPPIGVQVWEGTSVPRANVMRFTVATHVNSILPKLMAGLFYEDPPFLLRPRPGTTENTTRAVSAVEATQLDEMDFQEECRRAFFSALVFGTLIVKWGWHSETIKERVYVRKEQPAKIQALGKTTSLPTKASDEFEVKEIEKTIERPCFENKDIRFMLVDPALRVSDIRQAGFVIERMYLNYYDLEKLADETYFDAEGKEHKRYDLPSRDEVREWFEPPVQTPVMPNTAEQANQNTTLVHHAGPRFERTCADPFCEPLEVLERWDKGKVLTVLQRVRLIRNEANPCGGEIPYYSCNWWDVPDAFWGMGLGRVLGQDQRVQQGLINALLDITSLVVNPTYVRSAGANVPTQQIRQRIGGIIDVQGEPDKAFKLLEQPRIPPEIFAEIQQSEARAESTSGANELLTQGSMPSQGRTSMGRTATGAGAMSQAIDNRLGGFVETFIRNVYEPWLYQIHELNCERLPLSTLREILKGEAPSEFDLSVFKEEDYLNARFRFDVLAGAHMSAKQQMAQSMTLMIQIFENPPLMEQLALAGKKINIEELFHMIHDLSGYKNYYDIIQPLTPEDKQRQQQQNPGMQKAQAADQASDKKFKQQQALVDQKNEAGMARDIVKAHTETNLDRGTNEIERQAVEKAGTGPAVAGTPGPQGFGSQETA